MVGWKLKQKWEPPRPGAGGPAKSVCMWMDQLGSQDVMSFRHLLVFFVLSKIGPLILRWQQRADVGDRLRYIQNSTPRKKSVVPSTEKIIRLSLKIYYIILMPLILLILTRLVSSVGQARDCLLVELCTSESGSLLALAFPLARTQAQEARLRCVTRLSIFPLMILCASALFLFYPAYTTYWRPPSATLSPFPPTPIRHHSSCGWLRLVAELGPVEVEEAARVLLPAAEHHVLQRLAHALVHVEGRLVAMALVCEFDRFEPKLDEMRATNLTLRPPASPISVFTWPGCTRRKVTSLALGSRAQVMKSLGGIVLIVCWLVDGFE